MKISSVELELWQLERQTMSRKHSHFVILQTYLKSLLGTLVTFFHILQEFTDVHIQLETERIISNH
jgi:hypothetical protein